VIKVLLVDDQGLLRAGLRAILEGAEDLEVVGEAGNGYEALKLGRELRPSVFLMDLQMPQMNGHEAIRAIRADPLLKRTPVLVLTTFDDDDDVVEALAAGANGYLLKDLDAEDLRRAVRNAAEGRVEMAPGVLRQMMNRIARLPTGRSRSTPRSAVRTSTARTRPARIRTQGARSSYTNLPTGSLAVRWAVNENPQVTAWVAPMTD
jgi:DNA-binding NarL/FixJ family response regulator